MIKKAYKELQKKLTEKYTKPIGTYTLITGVECWLSQNNIVPTAIKIGILCDILGGIPYPYQEEDKKFILQYLKITKYKLYKKEKDLKC